MTVDLMPPKIEREGGEMDPGWKLFHGREEATSAVEEPEKGQNRKREEEKH